MVTICMPWNFSLSNLLSLLRNIEDAGPVHPFASSVAAGIAGAVAAAASHSFDTAKSRSECTVVPKVQTSVLCIDYTPFACVITSKFDVQFFLFVIHLVYVISLLFFLFFSISQWRGSFLSGKHQERG